MLRCDVILTVLLIFSLYQSCTVCSAEKVRNKLLLVAFDGFRWDYLKYVKTPNFDKVVASGSKPPYMNGVYPSVTASSFYSIATGLYPESHGIINNNMYDPIFNKTFNDPNSTEPFWFEEAEPIWVTAERNGLKTGCFYFPGTNTKIHGYRPTFWLPFDHSVTSERRVDQVITWLVKDSVDFAILYFFEPDLTAHKTGPAPQSAATLKVIERCDSDLGYLLDRLKNTQLQASVNMIILSDHGFTPVTGFVKLHDFVDPEDIYKFEGYNILPTEGKLEKVYSQLKKMPNVIVYKKEEIPERFHYQHNRRILPLVLVPEEGTVVTLNSPTTLKGTHGFDNNLMNMKPFFLASGPDFKQNFSSPIFSQVDVYSLMCELLDISPSPHNGSLDTIGQILKEEVTNDNKLSVEQYALIIITMSGAALCLSILVIIYMFAKRHPRAPSPNTGSDVTYSKVPAEYVPL